MMTNSSASVLRFPAINAFFAGLFRRQGPLRARTRLADLDCHLLQDIGAGCVDHARARTAEQIDAWKLVGQQSPWL